MIPTATETATATTAASGEGWGGQPTKALRNVELVGHVRHDDPPAERAQVFVSRRSLEQFEVLLMDTDLDALGEPGTCGSGVHISSFQGSGHRIDKVLYRTESVVSAKIPRVL